MSTSRASYRLYGLALESAFDLPCPHAGPVQPDVRLILGSAARFARARSEVPPDNGREWFRYRRLGDGTTYLRWTGLFEFLVSADGRRIQYRRLEHATDESLSVYLLGTVLSFSMLAFGIEPLHGTVVLVDEGAIGFLGDCGDGKSTLGAAMLARGFRIVTDDLVALRETENGWQVQPGVPRIKLFPSVARRLLGRGRCGTRMNPGTTKLVLPLDKAHTVGTAVPLKALYVLSNAGDERRSRTARVRITPLFRQHAFVELIRASFNVLVLEKDRLANQFQFASRLLAAVPVRRLVYRRSLSELPTVCNAVLSDLGRESDATGCNAISA